MNTGPRGRFSGPFPSDGIRSGNHVDGASACFQRGLAMTEKHKGNKTGKSADRNITRSDAKKSVERIFNRNLLASAVVICAVGGGVLWYRSQAAGPVQWGQVLLNFYKRIYTY